MYRHDGTTRELDIDRIDTGPDWVQVYWAGMAPVEGIPANTLYDNFSADRNTMEQAQQTIGDRGERRIYRRC